MAVYIKAKKVINPAEYNQSADDLLEDFVLDELALEVKVEHEVETVEPVIEGTQDWALYVGADEPDWADGVTALDEQQGDLTEDIVVDDSDINLAAPGTYDLIYTVEDASGTEATTTVSVEVTYEVFDITYNLDGGTNDILNPDTFIETDMPITLEDATKDYYTFSAWHDAETLDSVVTQVTVAEDTELWADFTPISYTITYNLDGGENHIDNPATFTVEDLDITLSAPTKAAHNFVAWHDAATLDSPVTDITAAGNTELWAEFTPV
jgi:hypothetical protein